VPVGLEDTEDIICSLDELRAAAAEVRQQEGL
jgi:hypothetical protein